jgi:adenylate kinase family enzyme
VASARIASPAWRSWNRQCWPIRLTLEERARDNSTARGQRTVSEPRFQDQVSVCSARLEAYHAQTVLVLTHYERLDGMTLTDGVATIDKAHAELARTLHLTGQFGPPSKIDTGLPADIETS